MKNKRIVSWIKKNWILYTLGRLLLSLYYNYIANFFEYIFIWLRRNKIYVSKKYTPIKELKDRFQGERCFIVATGPSLTIDDCEKLKGEKTFSMNSIIDIFEQTTWRPTFYGIQDINVYEKYSNEIKSIPWEYLFVGSVIPEKFSVPKNSIIFNNYQLNHRMLYFHKHYYTRFSNDAYVTVYDGYTITYSLIQIAAYLGFKEIYLLGCDCSHKANSKEKQHIVEHGIYDPFLSTSQERMLHAYRVAKDYCEAKNIKIINATRGGELELFARADLDSLLL